MKTVRIAIVLISMAAISPYSFADEPVKEDESRVYLYIDSETGCEYLILKENLRNRSGAGGISPRMEYSGGEYLHKGCLRK